MRILRCNAVIFLAILSLAAILSQPLVAGMEPPFDQVFTYQGQLKQDGQPHTGSVPMVFSLWDQENGGSQIGSSWPDTIQVNNGLFTAEVYIANATWELPRYLQISVDGTVMGQRQRITPTPTSTFTFDGAGGGSAWTIDGSNIHFTGGNVGIGTSSTPERLNVTGNIALTGWLGHSMPAGTALPFVVSNQTAMRYVSGSESPNIMGGSLHNQITTTSGGNVIGGGGASGSANSITGDYSVIGGGSGHMVSGSNNVIAGGFENFITGDPQQAFIGGGYSNFVSADWGTIGGGQSNLVQADFSTVAGGNVNLIMSDAEYAFIGGGQNNSIQTGPSVGLGRYSGIVAGENNRVYSSRGFVGAGENNIVDANRAFVGAGNSNEASGAGAAVVGGSGNEATNTNAFIGGGGNNLASASNSMVVGGSNNVAAGQRSFAAGRRAEALHNGAFVWADSTTTTVQSTANDQFTVQASGGVRFFTNSALTSGVQVTAGGSAWSTLSDRDAKTDIESVQPREILANLVDIPILSWRYKDQETATRHMGPMAQDFHAAFGLGDDDKRLTTIDVDGVALAAIQGLYEEIQLRDQRIADLEQQISDLREQAETRLSALEQLLIETRQLAMGAGQ
jgi:hypothetical protein